MTDQPPPPWGHPGTAEPPPNGQPPPGWGQPPSPDSGPAGQQAGSTAEGEAGLVVVGMAAVKPRPLTWLVPGYVPAGKVTRVAGYGGFGKSLVTLDLAAAVSTGACAFGRTYAPRRPARCCWSRARTTRTTRSARASTPPGPTSG
jgi:hypothetical protein